jgi:hypothetical protein
MKKATREKIKDNNKGVLTAVSESSLLFEIRINVGKEKENIKIM